MSEDKNNGWISVKDRLPEMFVNVLVYSRNGMLAITCVDSAGKLDTYHLEMSKDKWTHWMPLPVPPTTLKN